jgi:hypothetical protein
MFPPLYIGCLTNPLHPPSVSLSSFKEFKEKLSACFLLGLLFDPEDGGNMFPETPVAF